MEFSDLKPSLKAIVSLKNIPVSERLNEICEVLKSEVPHYDWVGFYFKNGDKKELKLHAFSGESTEHTIIPFGKGICGQVAVSNENFVVPDVKGQDNYIACSISVKSEIVVPLFVNGENIGQIDIDSLTANSFTKKDEEFLEFVNEEIAGIPNLREELNL